MQSRRTISRLGFILVLVLVVSSLAGVAGAATDHFTDDNGNIHEANINYIADLGITVGCNAAGTLYCPDAFVTRAEMASFLARAFNLPDTTKDYFTDDTGSIHEANINRIAAAGITVGCNAAGTLYCPNQFVTRAEMASFIVRAMHLLPWTAYYFTDVPTTLPYHAANINALAGHRITVGCTADGKTFCPDANVKRDQMASFIARALQLGTKRAPVITITNPANLDTIITTFSGIAYTASIDFTATATDVNGGGIGASWRSVEPASGWLANLGTDLGLGLTNTATLSIPTGQQSSQPTIQVYAFDFDGLFSMDQVQIKLAVPSPS